MSPALSGCNMSTLSMLLLLGRGWDTLHTFCMSLCQTNLLFWMLQKVNLLPHSASEQHMLVVLSKGLPRRHLPERASKLWGFKARRHHTARTPAL